LVYTPRLAIRNNKAGWFSNIMPCYGAMPWGAGQCVRAQVAINYRRQFESSSMRINGRTGTSFDSSEDMEISFVAGAMGLGVGIFPELQLTHLIPKERLHEDYLVRLSEGIFTSNLLLEYKWRKAIPASPFAGFRGIPRLIKNVLARKGIRRRMYLAELRAIRRARRIILEHQAGRLDYRKHSTWSRSPDIR
jgi:hypothetical protein